MKVVHVIACLDTGGAEMMLYKLLSTINREAFETEVISLIDIGPIGQKIQALGVPVRALGMVRTGIPKLTAVLQLTHWLRQASPQVVQTWMYHADLIGGLAAKLAGNIPVAWGIRHTNLEPYGSRRSTIWIARACARLSHRLPTRVVCNAESSRQIHTKLGYSADKMMVIPNGFNLAAFKPDPAARRSVRQELDIPMEAPLIGLVARYHSQKDHHNFVQAAAQFLACVPQSHFLLCGDNVTWENEELASWIKTAGIQKHFHLLGRREDTPRLTAALDIASMSASYGEAFPVVIGEAMACGVPCVVTDVGDAAIIVGETGVVVPPQDPQALAMGWRQLLLDMGLEKRQHLGAAARQRVMERYSLEKVVEQYEHLYKSLAR